MSPITMNPHPVTSMPNSMTRLGPNLSIIAPTNGDMSPLSPRCNDMAAANQADDHPENDSKMGFTNAWKPRQNTTEA